MYIERISISDSDNIFIDDKHFISSNLADKLVEKRAKEIVAGVIGITDLSRLRTEPEDPEKLPDAMEHMETALKIVTDIVEKENMYAGSTTVSKTKKAAKVILRLSVLKAELSECIAQTKKLIRMEI